MGNEGVPVQAVVLRLVSALLVVECLFLKALLDAHKLFDGMFKRTFFARGETKRDMWRGE